MISFWRDRLFRETWHPSFEELMLFLDGELGAKRDRVGAHTKNCWSCRLRLEKIDRAISEFMEARNASFAGSSALPPHGLPQQFTAKLEQLEIECGSPSLFSGLFGEYARGLSALRISPKPAVLVASMALLAVIFFRLNLTQPVSAKEILFRVKEAEARELEHIPAPVIYEKLQLRVRSQNHSQAVTWEVWNDTRNNRLRRVREAEDEAGDILPVIDGFEEMFRTHRADLGRPLSAGNYEAWRGSIARESEEVIEGTLPDGQKATILKVTGQGPFATGAIVGTELTVRAADWHPVGQRLLVQKQNGVVDYSLGEVAFNVMSLSAVPASIFGEPRPAPVRTPYTPVRRLMPTPVVVDLWPADTDLLPSEAGLTAAEVEARYALHSVKACVGRPIEVRVGVGRIEVEGVADTEERKEEILLALRGIPHVAANIRTVAEAAAASTEGANDDVTGGETPKSKLAVEESLTRYFAANQCAGIPSDAQSACTRDQIASLSREALSRSEGAQAHAWALRRLVEWGPFLGRSALRTSSQRLLDLMLRDHMEGLRGELAEWRARLKPVLLALAGNDSTGSQTILLQAHGQQADWVASSLIRLCTSVEETGNLTLGTFAETNRPVTQPEQAIQELLANLNTLNRDFPKLEEEIGAELSDLPRVSVSREKLESNK